MNPTAVSCLSAALLAASLAAAGPQAPAKKDGGAAVISQRPDPQGDSPLVRAAKAAKKAREKKASTGKTITDASVKKSTGRLTVLSEGKAPGTPAPEDAEAAFAKMKQDRVDSAIQAEQARREVESLETEIAGLEKELASIEEDYYDESDVELRDDLSQRDFAKTKAALEAARVKLTAARKRHEDLSRASSNVFKP